MAIPYKLYGWSGSGSVAVQAALEECGVPYERIWVGKEPADIAEYRKINPTGKAPALALPDGTVMFESAAMLIHVAAAHPEAQLAPRAGTSRHALFLQWMVFLSANVYEAVLRLYYSDRYSSLGAAAADGIREKANADYLSHLELITGRLGPYVLGDHYSVADLYLYMLASWAPGEKSALYARLPALGMHAARLAARPAVVKVEADHAA
ncbi:MAG: glutathione S-transferase family protein [Steroidobacterales bacterium]